MQQKCFRNVWRLVLALLLFINAAAVLIVSAFPKLDYTTLTLLSQLTMLFPMIWGMCMLKKTFPRVPLNDSLCLHGFNPAILPFLIVLPLCCQSFVGIISLPLENLITKIFGEYDPGDYNFSNAYTTAVNIFMLVIAAPVIEEIIFRGVIFRMLERYGMLTAVLVSAFIFALAHMDITSFIAIFALGVMFALVKYFTGSLWTTIIMHMANNLISVLELMSISSSVSGGIFAGAVTLAWAIAFPFLFILCMRMIRKRDDWWRGVAWTNGVHAEFSVCLIIVVSLYAMLQVYMII